METGEVTFTLTSDDISDIEEAQFNLEKESIEQELITEIEESVPGVSVENVDVNKVIAAEIEFTIDANDAQNDLTQAAFEAENLFTDDFEVSVDNSFVTMGPSLTPTTVPITSIPTIAPTITGAVALIELTSVVDEEISEDLLSNITQQIVSEYGVDEEDIEIEVDYIVNGTFEIEGEVPTDLQERELLIETPYSET